MGNNDITGARLVSKANTKEYEDNYEKIFGKSKECSTNNNCDACVSSRYDMDCCETVSKESI